MKAQSRKKSYRVLCLDGGGMRGLYTASVLRTLMRCFCKADDDRDIGKAFDLIVGTSTGGILACGLATGIPISRIMEFYLKKGKKIFTDPFPHKKLKQFFWLLRNNFSSANSSSALVEELFHVFGDKTMTQIYNERHIGLCVTAVRLRDHVPEVFKTPHKTSQQGDNSRKLVDVCLATSSAPLLFPVAHLTKLKGKYKERRGDFFVDGGLWANNPVLLAMTEALACAKENQSIEIVSLGTCPPPVGKIALNSLHQKGGFSQWRYGMNLMELTVDSQSKAHHFLADLLCSQFRSFGKGISVYRLKQTISSVEQAKFLFLDQSGEKTCSLLMKLGETDGRNTYENERIKNRSVLKDIFSHLSDLE